MLGIIWLLLFLCSGVVIAEGLLDNFAPSVRRWFGCVIGFVLAMWLPVLLAFALRFTLAVQFIALVLALGGATAVYLLRREAFEPKRLLGMRREADTARLLPLLAVVVPLLVISAYLQYTHNMRMEGGAYYVGQSTFSDINLHLSIVTGIRDSAFPPEYILLPGTRLCYPFLTDSLSGSMYMLGTDMAMSLVIPSTLMMALVYYGYAQLAWSITKKHWMAVLCVLFLFVNGGFGFANMIDQAGRDPSAFREIFTGYYKTPTNLPDLNLRWSNILVDMLVPQRTFLAGWLVLMPVLYAVIEGARTQQRRTFIAAGLLAGCMPMINTHAFLAVGLGSIGFMCCQLVSAALGRRRGDADAPAVQTVFTNYLIYGCIAVAMALPQIFIWTLNQATQGGFVKLHFNWVNNDGGLIDEYFWFWIKNIGPAALLIIPAAIDARGRERMLVIGAFVIFIIADNIVFQPLVYDNNKLYYVWYALMLPVVFLYVGKLIAACRAHKLRGMALVLALFIATGLFGGALTIGREWISNYQLYSSTEVTAMRYVDEKAPQDAIFLTAGQHNNAVSTLAGRKLVCGSATFLYFHGLNYRQQEFDARAMFEFPEANAALFEQYGVDYIYVSNQERSRMALDEEEIARLYPLWYSYGDIDIYAVSERAKALIDPA